MGTQLQQKNILHTDQNMTTLLYLCNTCSQAHSQWGENVQPRPVQAPGPTQRKHAQAGLPPSPQRPKPLLLVKPQRCITVVITWAICVCFGPQFVLQPNRHICVCCPMLVFLRENTQMQIIHQCILLNSHPLLWFNFWETGRVKVHKEIYYALMQIIWLENIRPLNHLMSWAWEKCKS